ncbi:MAG: ATP-binding protein, partial [Candidatus Gastranaerophilales bacterium]|nr:ATP-binding protein [Candidatus Gastranaerophilales bacterium]
FVAYSGKQALEAVNKEKFDLILLDVMMPKMSGFEVIKRLKSDPKTKDIPVIFITALNETDDIIKGLNLGSYEYIIKPFNIDELKARIINILKIQDLQDQLREEKNKLDLIFRFSADGIVMLNSSFKIVSCNEQFVQWFGSCKEEILGRDFHEFFNCYCRESNKCAGLEFLGLNSFSEISVKNENGEKIYQINYSKIFENESEAEGYVLVLRDITEHKEIEKQKETFVATLTHDLKTPIRAEIMAMELLLKGNFGRLTEEQTDIIRDTLYSSKYMFSMVDNLLTTYRYENGNISLNLEDIDIINLIKSCYNELKYLIEDKNQIILFEFMENNIIISADIMELKRVIINLLFNAATYTQEYGKIVIKSEIKYNEVQISFIDNGKGISEQDMSMLFNKYTSHAKKFRQVGTGLGLYLSKQIVEAHGGSITIESQENKGSKFTFSLPLVHSLV